MMQSELLFPHGTNRERIISQWPYQYRIQKFGIMLDVFLWLKLNLPPENVTWIAHDLYFKHESDMIWFSLVWS